MRVLCRHRGPARLAAPEAGRVGASFSLCKLPCVSHPQRSSPRSHPAGLLGREPGTRSSRRESAEAERRALHKSWYFPNVRVRGALLTAARLSGSCCGSALLTSMNPIHQTFTELPLGVRDCPRHGGRGGPSFHQQMFTEHRSVVGTEQQWG